MDAKDLTVAEKVSASKKLGRTDAEAMLADAAELIVAKGKKLTRFDVKEGAAEDAVTAMLGPTGNLRAPTLRVGKTILVGFNQEVYDEVLG